MGRAMAVTVEAELIERSIGPREEDDRCRLRQTWRSDGRGGPPGRRLVRPPDGRQRDVRVWRRQGRSASASCASRKKSGGSSASGRWNGSRRSGSGSWPCARACASARRRSGTVTLEIVRKYTLEPAGPLSAIAADALRAVRLGEADAAAREIYRRTAGWLREEDRWLLCDCRDGAVIAFRLHGSGAVSAVKPARGRRSARAGLPVRAARCGGRPRRPGGRPVPARRRAGEAGRGAGRRRRAAVDRRAADRSRAGAEDADAGGGAQPVRRERRRSRRAGGLASGLAARRRGDAGCRGG